MTFLRLAIAGFSALALVQVATSGAAYAAEDHALKTPSAGWSFEGYFGSFDRNQLQRGYKVYREVCSTCHGMKLLSFRNLAQKGGPFYEAEFSNPNDNPIVKTLAAEIQIPSIDPETGDPVQVAAKASDGFPSPYANEAAARALNGGALPPDLSVMAKARHGGASYIYSLLTGYYEAPEGLTVSAGQHYNAYFPGDTAAQWSGDPRHKPAGGFLAMSPPLIRDGQVTFDDGAPSTIDSMAADVAAYIAWASDPKMETRKQMGAAVIGYLALLAVLVFLSYRRIWRNVEH
jgi:ubiquinol-cytochrome c reductase cytochrome c1 subunit